MMLRRYRKVTRIGLASHWTCVTVLYQFAHISAIIRRYNLNSSAETRSRIYRAYQLLFYLSVVNVLFVVLSRATDGGYLSHYMVPHFVDPKQRFVLCFISCLFHMRDQFYDNNK